MKVYLVGGAVRDDLLGLTVKERDWLVVGASARDMLDRGYKRVGKDFPVFLHPETHEEYALARTERKTAPGYRGFSVHASPEVTVDEDLARRDLTINALARDAGGRLIDPYNGMADIEGRWLRHVSRAFVEDPVRVLRVARFAARYADLGFRVAPETLELMAAMVASGEVDALVPERVWAETVRALAEPRPGRFIQVLRECGALRRIFPEIDALFGVPQTARYHPEVDTGVHVLMALEQAVRLGADATTRFAVLLHDLGKGATPKAEWPRHIGHEERSAQLVRGFCQRVRAPNEFRDLAVLVAAYHTHCHRALHVRPKTLLKTLGALDALRKPARFERFLLACEADARGRKGLEARDYSQVALMRAARQAAADVDVRPLLARGLKGEALKQAIQRARLKAVTQARRGFRSYRVREPDLGLLAPGGP
jgi:tRNA nucleotidyltransferase (CCA-adding enzyme)